MLYFQLSDVANEVARFLSAHVIEELQPGVGPDSCKTIVMEYNIALIERLQIEKVECKLKTFSFHWCKIYF